MIIIGLSAHKIEHIVFCTWPGDVIITLYTTNIIQEVQEVICVINVFLESHTVLLTCEESQRVWLISMECRRVSITSVDEYQAMGRGNCLSVL